MSKDPVFYGQGVWWFYDETWASRHGPFNTQEEAREALKKYAKFLDEGPVKEDKDE